MSKSLKFVGMISSTPTLATLETTAAFGTKYSRMDQVKFVEDSL